MPGLVPLPSPGPSELQLLGVIREQTDHPVAIGAIAIASRIEG